MGAVRTCKRKGCTNLMPMYGRKLFCSNACKSKDYRMRCEPTRKMYKAPVIHWCRTCGKQYQTTNELSVYCKRACKQQFYREQKALRVPRQLTIPDSAYTISNTRP